MSQIKMIRCASRVLAGVAQRAELSDFAIYTSGPRNSRSMASKAVTLDNINPNILKLEYAVRGPLVIRAAEIEKELEKVSSQFKITEELFPPRRYDTILLES